MSGVPFDRGPGDLSDEARALVAAAERTRPLGAADRARHAPRIAKIAAAPAAAAAGGVAWLKLVGAGVGAAVLVTAVVVAGTRRDRATPPPAHAPPAASAPAAPVPVPSSAPATAPTAPLLPAAAPVVAAAPAAREPARAAPRASAAPSAESSRLPATPPAAAPSAPLEALGAPTAGGPAGVGPEPPLAQESRLLTQASALVARDPAAALARVEAHASQFPSGQLALEREVLAVDALVRLGRLDEARARGAAVIARNPRSARADRVRRMLAGAP